MSKTWRERIAEARENGSFTAQDVQDASCWSCCAVGEQRQNMPNIIVYVEGGKLPKDKILRKLGERSYGAFWLRDGFYAAVFKSDFDKAERLLDAIEDRALQLKREATS